MRLKATLSLFAVVPSLFAQNSYLLKADGVSDTYSLIEKAGFFAETSGNMRPDEFMGHPDYEHISQVEDPESGEYVFAFDIHVNFSENGNSVTDGNKSELIDRQRNEIKCMSSQPATVATDGECINYRWKFMLPEGMLTTKEFCHIHQIKGMGDSEEVAHPVFTLTCRTTSSKQVLQVINVPFEGSANVNLAQIDLKPLLGKWIEVDEYVTVGKHGSYYLSLTDAATKKKLLEVDKKDIQVWRNTDDNSTMRGKWGIYRSLGSNLELIPSLRSERILFADIEAIKGEAGVAIVNGDDLSGDAAVYDLYGRKVSNPTRGIYIKKGKKILIH